MRAYNKSSNNLFRFDNNLAIGNPAEMFADVYGSVNNYYDSNLWVILLLVKIVKILILLTMIFVPIQAAFFIRKFKVCSIGVGCI